MHSYFHHEALNLKKKPVDASVEFCRNSKQSEQRINKGIRENISQLSP